MKAIDQKLLSNEAEIDKNAKHCSTPSVDSGLPSVTTQRKGSSKPISRVLYPSYTGRTVTICLALPFPEGSSGQPGDRPGVLMSLYLALLRMGFTQPTGHPAAGGLLPHHFTLALPVWEGRCVSVALSIGSPLLGVTQHPARRSSDFPPFPKEGRPPGLLDLPIV